MVLSTEVGKSGRLRVMLRLFHSSIFLRYVPEVGAFDRVVWPLGGAFEHHFNPRRVQGGRVDDLLQGAETFRSGLFILCGKFDTSIVCSCRLFSFPFQLCLTWFFKQISWRFDQKSTFWRWFYSFFSVSFIKLRNFINSFIS